MMKVIIEHGNTKRTISGPFNICGDANDLRRIRNAIDDALLRDEGRWSYGWIEVIAPDGMRDNFIVSLKQKSVVNQEPINWDSPAQG